MLSEWAVFSERKLYKGGLPVNVAPSRGCLAASARPSGPGTFARCCPSCLVAPSPHCAQASQWRSKGVRKEVALLLALTRATSCSPRAPALAAPGIVAVAVVV